MKAKLIATLTLIFFIAGIAVEIGDFHHGEEKSSYQSVSSTGQVMIENDCQNCPEDDEHDTDGHCAHHCNGLHNISLFTNDVSVNSPLFTKNSEFWNFGFIYQSPFIDPALKPPTFS